MGQNLPTYLSHLDYVIVAAYLTASIVLGLRFARGQRDLEDYFVAERSAPWWIVGVSIIASDFSAISYIGAPGWVFQHDLKYALGILLFPVFMLMVVYLFVPFLARLRLLTVYEYLEHRFGLAPRTLASALFLLMRGGHLANAIWSLGLVIIATTGLAPTTAVILVGAVTSIYTALGGMKAVLWTDFLQFFVLVGSILAMLGVVVFAFGGDLGHIWALAAAGGHTRMVDLSLDPRIEVTLWGLVLGMLIINVSAYGSDQVIVQRYLTTGSRTQMVRAIMFGGIVTVPLTLALYALGVGLCAYYRVHPALASTLTEAKNVVPHFVSNVLPSGVRGLVIAGLFAATMSSMSAGFNSLSTASIVDFYLRFRRGPSRSDQADVLSARLATLGWGVVCTVVALHIDRLGNVLEIMGKINGFLSGPLIGMFVLGVLTRRANGFGVLAGALIGVAVTWWVSVLHLPSWGPTESVSWLWYAPVGCAATLIAGALLSYLAPAPALEVVAPLTLKGDRDAS